MNKLLQLKLNNNYYNGWHLVNNPFSCKTSYLVIVLLVITQKQIW